MVTESLDRDPLLMIGLISFSKSQSYKKIFFKIGPSTWLWSPNPLDLDPLLGISLIWFFQKN